MHILDCLLRVVFLNSFCLFSRVAATNSGDCFFCNASTPQAPTAQMQDVPWQPAWVYLTGTANTSPTHAIIVIRAAFGGTEATLIVKQDAADALVFFIFRAAASHVVLID